MFKYNLDTVLMCLGLFAVGFHLNGTLALYQAIACLLSGTVCEYIAFKLILRKEAFKDLSVIASSLIIALLLPACAPLYTGIFACAFAVFVAKMPFGGSNNAPFIPAAAGFCFVALLFPREVFTYSALTDTAIGLYSTDAAFRQGISLLDMIKDGTALKLNFFNISNLLSGDFPGATGTTSLLALFGVAAYRLVRDKKRLVTSVSFLLGALVLILILTSANTDLFSRIVTELSAGSLIFTALLIVSDPVTAPERPLRMIVYGLLTGFIAILLRRFGNIYDGSVFAVLIMNALWPAFTGESAGKKFPAAEKKPAKAKKEKAAKQKPSPKQYTPSYNLFEEEIAAGGKDNE